MAEDKEGFDAIIEACEIFKKYSDTPHPFHCEHDQLYVNVSPEEVADEDIDRLDELGFFPGEGDWTANGFISYRYGSC